MINTTQLQKVALAWTSIVWTVCYLGVLLFPDIRSAFALYALHLTTSFGENVMTLTTFVSGLVIWNIVAWLAVGLFASLFNRMRA
ncbi:MAG: DUF5676 family membrane protein [Candidatus Paceibacterota bacterium]|jgi:hypothetical protein